MTDSSCDDKGLCSPKPLAESTSTTPMRRDAKLIYVGDPMCSWCWGIAPALKEVRQHYDDRGIGFEIIAGGLRPGGGDPWDEQMKSFLRHHWAEVTARSGQPFGYDLFDRDEFNYDTEPACRAVVTAKGLLDEAGTLRFFEAVQRKFYVDNEDPSEVSFYESICKASGIDFGDFSARFHSDALREQTRQEFLLNRQWGVKGYPTLVLQFQEQLFLVTNGFATALVMKDRIDQLLEEAPISASDTK